MHNAVQPTPPEIVDKFVAEFPGDVAALERALHRRLSGESEIVREYEKALGVRFGSPNAIALSSGGAALSVGLHAAGIGRGDEVILTPTAPLCTLYPILMAGAKAVFVDTCSNGFGIAIDQLNQVLTPKTKALIETPMWGLPTPVDALHNFTEAAQITLILDLAHAHGTRLNGRFLNEYGDFSAFSTHERKVLSTGEGGFLLARDPRLALRARDYSRFGNLAGEKIGLNYKLSGFQAALGLSRLKLLDSHLAKRKQNARRLLDQISNPRVRQGNIIPGGEPNYYTLLLVLGFADNARFIRYLSARGIPSDIQRYGCRALFRFPVAAQFRRDCPNAEALLARMTTLPVHPGITGEDIDYMSEAINQYSEE